MNLWDFPKGRHKEELCRPLLERPGMRVEQIVSTGQASPPGFWYDQVDDEWIVLLQGCAWLRFDMADVFLTQGDTLLIPAHLRHRVEFTTITPPCLWLCVFASPNLGALCR